MTVRMADAEIEAALAGLNPAYLPLAGGLLAGLAEDPRVSRVLLTGSIGAGRADLYSDLDVSVAVCDAESVAGLVADLPALIGQVAYSRFLTSGPMQILTVVTAEWLRVDVLVESLAVAARHAPPAHLVAYDDWTSELPAPPGGANERIADPVALVESFLRVLGLLDVILGREEFFVGAQGVMLLRDYLIDLFYLQNGLARRGGVKHVNSGLTSEQIALLAGQPPVTLDRASVLAGHLAAAQTFLPLAQATVTSLGLHWPEEFCTATRQHLRRSLDVSW